MGKKESLIHLTNKDFIATNNFDKEKDTPLRKCKVEAQKILGTEKVLSIVDASIEFDGQFFEFCEENGYSTKSLEFFSVVTLADREVDQHDPYVACGTFLVEKGDLKFIKYADFNDSGDFDKIISVVLVPESSYAGYLEFKSKYQEWDRKENGTMVSVVGGEDYLIRGDKKVDDLFFGEYKKLKDEVFGFVKNFLNSEKFYKENKIPWKSAVYIEGVAGSGKTEFVNTIVSNFDLAPIAVNKYNCDDSVLEYVFNLASGVRKSIVIIENIGELITQELVSVDTLIEFLDKGSNDNGVMLIITSREKVPAIDKISFRFDKFIKLALPTYKESVDNLFGDLVSKSSLFQFKKDLVESQINYGYLRKVRELFFKINIGKIQETTKKIRNKNKGDLDSILGAIKKESDKKLSKTKANIKIGLIKGRE